MSVFFFLEKKLKFEFRSQNALVWSLFSAFGINTGFLYAKKKTIIMKMRVQKYETTDHKQKYFTAVPEQ
jgi:hypothetical protein